MGKPLGCRLRTLRQAYKGKKLSDGKVILGKGRLTDRAIYLLQNYFGMAIRQNNDQKQPFRGVLRKSSSEDMQEIYRRTPMPKCDFNKNSSEGLRLNDVSSIKKSLVQYSFIVQKVNVMNSANFFCPRTESSWSK